MNLRSLYYLAKPLLPRRLQLAMRWAWVRSLRPRYARVWPIDPDAGRKPDGWTGWPTGRQFALVLTHDVESALGVERVKPLCELETALGFTSSFNFVPERYDTPVSLRQQLIEEGFEVGVHGLNHDGKLYSSRTEFDRRARLINGYLRDWGAVGFRSPAMHHDLAWIGALEIEYDLSTFDVDPFEAQPDGVGTIFPFLVESRGHARTYVELPYTLPQDFTLFCLMREKSPEIWRRKLDWIAERGGMALVNVHPDYMRFDTGGLAAEQFDPRHYRELLEYVRERHEGRYWHALPREVAAWARSNGAPLRVC